ncbi:MAG: dihydrodipicolinate synthase family protein [Negativicutes bacterium]|nr:dihydrodipicolinate synthase family protein [Negativicutes bacterium]
MFVLKNAYAPIPTPFENNGEISYPMLKANLEKWATSRLEGLVVCGSNGEFTLLDEDEKAAMFAFARKHFPAGRGIIAGTGCESLRATLRLTRKAAEAGCDAALIVTPWYYKSGMNADVLKAYYTQLADESPIPVILYNMPRNTGVEMNSALISELSKHQNIIGIKDSSGNIVQIAETLAHGSKDFAVFAGSASFLYASMVLGAAGATMALANVLPDLCVDLMELCRKGESAKAQELQLSILGINAAVTSRFGIGGMKAACELMGYYGGPLRKPLRSASPEAVAQIRQMLVNLGAL